MDSYVILDIHAPLTSIQTDSAAPALAPAKLWITFGEELQYCTVQHPVPGTVQYSTRTLGTGYPVL